MAVPSAPFWRRISNISRATSSLNQGSILFALLSELLSTCTWYVIYHCTEKLLWLLCAFSLFSVPIGMEHEEQDTGGDNVDRAEAKGLIRKCTTCGKAFETGQGLKNHVGRRKNFLCHRDANKPKKKEEIAEASSVAPATASMSGEIKRTFYSKYAFEVAFNLSITHIDYHFRNDKQLAINVYEQHLDEGFQRLQALQETSKKLSMPLCRIQEFLNEKTETGTLVSNERKRYQSKNMYEKLDDLQRNIIRRTVTTNSFLILKHIRAYSIF